MKMCFCRFVLAAAILVIAIFWWPAEWYARIGTERSKGTKLVSLSGNIINTRVAEVPFGTTIREIVTGIGCGNFISRYQWVDTGENCERFVTSAKRKFLSYREPPSLDTVHS